MISRLTTIFFLLVLAMSTSVAWGQGFPKDSVSNGDNNVVAPETFREDTEVWCQEWSGCPGAYTSQIDTGPLNMGGEGAEDFISNTDSAITSLVWWGAQRDGATPPDYFVITFYAYSNDCSQPDTGIIISQQSIYTYNQQPTGTDLFFIYSGTLNPVLMDAGRQYWISIRAVLFVEEIPGDPVTYSTQWYWAMNDEALECPAIWRGDIFGFPDWTTLHTVDPDYQCGDAFAFCLYTDMAVPTESSSWGAVKSLYR